MYLHAHNWSSVSILVPSIAWLQPSDSWNPWRLNWTAQLLQYLWHPPSYWSSDLPLSSALPHVVQTVSPADPSYLHLPCFPSFAQISQQLSSATVGCIQKYAWYLCAESTGSPCWFFTKIKAPNCLHRLQYLTCSSVSHPEITSWHTLP